MLGNDFVKERINRALELSESDETQVVLLAQDQALTRFANNIIHQNVSESNGVVTITAVLGQRTGMASWSRHRAPDRGSAPGAGPRTPGAGRSLRRAGSRGIPSKWLTPGHACSGVSPSLSFLTAKSKPVFRFPTTSRAE